MSKYFGWLKKNKKQNEAQNEPQQGLQPESLPHEPQGEVVQADVVSSTPQTSDITPVPKDDLDNSSTHTSGEPTPKANSVRKAEVKVEADINREAKISAEPAPLDKKDQAPLSPEQSEEGFFSKLKRGLSRTKENFGSGFVSLFRGKAINDELFEELETQLLVADVGMDTTNKIIKHLTDTANRKQLKDGEALYQLLKEQMADILSQVDKPLKAHSETGPFVILMVGVNGVGKTTTIGKMAKQFQQQGKKVMLAAGDTFRAAAVEQLQVWGERNNIPVVAQQTGSDSASVVFDALQSAQARNIDVLIADTAGRLQNKEHLMEELKKVVRVMKKINPHAPHEIMLTLDAGTGQNAISQTRLFHQAVGITGLSLTKLDGTAKGGVIFAIADQFNIPIRYIGVGEGIDDLRPFDSPTFVDALFSENHASAEGLASPTSSSQNLQN
ncbi:MAG: fused signal recognition particle receptor [Paraglaciecola sp.]|jgi:fused signal recognition particle receptor